MVIVGMSPTGGSRGEARGVGSSLQPRYVMLVGTLVNAHCVRFRVT